MAMAKADLVLRGGKVFLGLNMGFSESVAIRGGRVIAHGSNSALEGLVGADTRLVELNGRLAAPGLNDAHQHLLAVDLGLSEVDCKTDTQLEVMLNKIKSMPTRRSRVSGYLVAAMIISNLMPSAIHFAKSWIWLRRIILSM